ncbi:transcriptional regulator, TetR family [Luminiphilus syltensis NOR5-1B]|uniref:Transcriptional regulator, TetR family n=1 Tax=Luminiphilus syltensis NOR5-1B TaxID=565045 RepID=B8KT61_9GAMM|nr:TetR/AcrR family transcriptional regulator [Luminiphilus syltensis]EED35700.1 transcriptional regulator, TetR family [Luminiphilus syltensis NOR5-1B]
MKKKPTQSRSRMTVMSVQQACQMVFERCKSGRVAVKTISEEAGVAMGSIYQYFTCLESIIGSIYEERIEQALQGGTLSVTDTPKMAALHEDLARLDETFGRNYFRDFYSRQLSPMGIRDLRALTQRSGQSTWVQQLAS